MSTVQPNTRMLYYFVLWVLYRLDVGMENFLNTMDPSWKERVLQSEGVHRHRANQWKRRVHKYNVLHNSYLSLLQDIEQKNVWQV